MERHRLVIAFAIAVAPVAGMIGFGCSSDDETPAVGMIALDPGGTFGAEVSIRVVGRGRISGNIPSGIDCPGNCYVRYTFNSATDKGASDGLTLKAITTPGAKFVGWTFENEQLATKSRGPDNCNPVKRGTSQPGDSNNPELKLQFGDTQGSPPSGQEGACTGDYVKVPVAYKLTARFEDIPEAAPPDSGDAGDGGDGSTPGTLLFDTPVAGATGGEIFIVNGRLYWKYITSGGLHGIASGLANAIAPATPQVLVSPVGTIPKFEGDYQNVSFQTSANTLGVFNSSNPTIPITNFDNAVACDALETHYSANTLFCLSSGNLYSWSATSGGARTFLTSAVPAVPAGRNFGVTFSYFWVVNDPGTTNGASIQRLSRSSVDNDGGPLTWTPFITAETNPLKLMVQSSSEYLFWIEYSSLGDLGEVHASSSSSSTVYTPVLAQSGLRFIAPDPSSGYVVAGVAPAGGVGGQIYRNYYASSGSGITAAVTGIPNMTGVAADSTYYYWTQNDGRVYRRVK